MYETMSPYCLGRLKIFDVIIRDLWHFPAEFDVMYVYTVMATTACIGFDSVLCGVYIGVNGLCTVGVQCLLE